MKKLVKLSIILYIVIILCGNCVFAASELTPNSFASGTSFSSSSTNYLFSRFINNVVRYISTIGSIISVVALVVIGIKYMIGSIDEKAEYKKSLLPYVIGCVMIFLASVLTGIIYTIITTSIKTK
jgi:type IV secretory pathway VirB2 component (pilin)